MAIDKDKLERVQALASIASSIAIPVVLAVIGYLVQRQLANEGLKKDYVSIAVGILNNTAPSQEPDLRKWAVTVLDANSPIPFSAKAKEVLEKGPTIPVVVAPPAIPTPPDVCMEPVKDRKIYAAYGALAKKAERAKDQKALLQAMLDFSELVRNEEAEAMRAVNELQCMQRWARDLNEGDEALRKKMGFESSKSVYERLNRERAASAAAASATSSASAVKGK